jgi:hypothetical protein
MTDRCPFCGTETAHLFTDEPTPVKPKRKRRRPRRKRKKEDTVLIPDKASSISLISKYDKLGSGPVRQMLKWFGFFLLAVVVFIIVCPKSKTRVIHVDTLPPRDTQASAYSDKHLLALSATLMEDNPDSAAFLIALADSINPLPDERVAAMSDAVYAAVDRAERSSAFARAEALLVFLDRHDLLDSSGKRRLRSVLDKAAAQREEETRFARGEYRTRETIRLESGLRVTLTGVGKQEVIRGRKERFNSPGGYFLVASLRFANSDRANYFDLSKMILTADGGSSYVPQMDHLYALNRVNALFELEPNETVTYRAAFQVPHGDRGFVLHLGPNAFSKDYHYIIGF